MTAKVSATLFEGFNIFLLQIFFGNAAMHFQCTDGCNDNCSSRCKARFAALNIKEFFSAKISTKASFCHHIISQLQSCLCGHN